MKRRVLLGAVMLHSIKHPEVFASLLEAHEDYVLRGSPQPNTLTIEEYVQQRESTVISEDGGPLLEGETIRA